MKSHNVLVNQSGSAHIPPLKSSQATAVLSQAKSLEQASTVTGRFNILSQ